MGAYNLVLLLDGATPGGMPFGRTFYYLGEYWTTAKPPSERQTHHLLGFSNLGEHWAAAKPPSGRQTHHSVGFYKLRRAPGCSYAPEWEVDSPLGRILHT